MNWINSVVRPKIQSFLNKRETPDNLWVKCPQSGEMVFYRDLEANQWVVPNSGFHMKIKSRDRLKSFLDDGKFTEIETPDVPVDPLKFRDSKKYTDRLRESRAKTDMKDAVLVATGKLLGRDVTVGVQDFDFMGGSLGMAAGAAIVKAVDTAIKNKTAFVLFTASGGARMQEGMLSLMQMPRTTVALQRLKEAGLPYIVVLTNPTTGGVTASYAMLGDVQIAEPDALIGFAGQRVIEQTIREKLPKGFQRSEYLYDHGMIDMVVHRHDLRSTIGRLIGIFTKSELNEIETTSAKRKSVRDAVAESEGEEAKNNEGPAEGDLRLEQPPVAHAE